MFQPHVVKALSQSLLDLKAPEVTLLIGESGLGKTSVGRLLAACLLCKNLLIDGSPCLTCTTCQDIFEGTFQSGAAFYVNGRVDSTVDFHREMVNRLQTPGLYTKRKVILIDEAQGLSKDALEVYLAPLERKSKDVYYIFCTTEGAKIKKSLSSRTWDFQLRRPSADQLCRFIFSVCQQVYPKVELPKTFVEEGIPVIAQASDGNIRAAGNILEKIITSKDLSIENVNALTAQTDSSMALTVWEKVLSKGKPDESLKFVRAFVDSEEPFAASLSLSSSLNALVSSRIFGDTYRPAPAWLAAVDLKRLHNIFDAFLDFRLKTSYYLDRTLLMSFFIKGGFSD